MLLNRHQCWTIYSFTIIRVRVMVFNTTFNNISVISWWSVLLVEETGVPEENHWTATNHCQTLSHNVVKSTPAWVGFKLNYKEIIQQLNETKFVRWNPILIIQNQYFFKLSLMYGTCNNGNKIYKKTCFQFCEWDFSSHVLIH